MDNMLDLDNRLAAGGVHFLPWIGKDYQSGFKGRRLLVVAESHYKDDGSMPTGFTRTCVDHAKDREAHISHFWKYLEQVHLNVERTSLEENGGTFWDKVAFYNFIQTWIGTDARQSPQRRHFAEAHRPFFAILNALRPERVLVCGKRLWGGMPEPEDFCHDDVQAYRLQGGEPAWCLATVHPSSGRYSWRRLHPLVDAFMSDPAKACASLSGSAGSAGSPAP